MSVLLPGQDYTDRDFDALRVRLISLVKSVFPQWSDFDVASFGTLLVEMYAFVGDVLGYYLDNQGRESRLATATQRKNVIALARMLGYRLRGVSAARAEVRLSLSRPPAADVTLPAGLVVRTREVTQSVRFELLAPVTIAAGQDPPEVLAMFEHSTGHTQRYGARGRANLEVILDQVPYLDGSARVVSGGVRYDVVESFLSSGPNDAHLTVDIDSRERARLRFGDGVRGRIPSGTIEIRYRTGGGPAGNVEAGRLVVVEGAYTDAFGLPVQVQATNPERAFGGAARESIAEARLRAPQSLRATKRSVTREDFELHALEIPGVARALMLTSDQTRAIDENTGVLFIVPEGGGDPIPALRQRVYRRVSEERPHTLTFQVSVQGPRYLTVDIRTWLEVDTGVSAVNVRERVRARLREMFELVSEDGTPNPAINFGYHLRRNVHARHGELAWSDVFNVIRDTPGVRRLRSGDQALLLNGRPQDVRVGLAEFPVLGDVAVVDVTTNREI